MARQSLFEFTKSPFVRRISSPRCCDTAINGRRFGARDEVRLLYGDGDKDIRDIRDIRNIGDVKDIRDWPFYRNDLRGCNARYPVLRSG